MTGSSTPKTNVYLSGSLPRLFARTAAPIIVVMGVNGLFTVVDAYFLGAYVGAEALTAVTLMFPLYMLLVALSTLVSNGFAACSPACSAAAITIARAPPLPRPPNWRWWSAPG